MHSCIYEGTVRHRRFLPFTHSFRYPLFLMYLDLRELDEVFRGRWLWSSSRPNLAWFRRGDHLGDPRLPLDEAVRDLVSSRTGRRPTGPIRLLTNLRYYGYVMNPVSFYFCFDAMDQRLDAIVAEVTNTPWGERHCYVLSESSFPPDRRVYRFGHPKEFHVSPFMDIKMHYRWRITEPRKRLVVHIDNYEKEAKLFDATMVLQRRETKGRELARLLIRYPFMTAKVAMAIYWQALKLWRKKAPFFNHPKNRRQSRSPVESQELQTAPTAVFPPPDQHSVEREPVSPASAEPKHPSILARCLRRGLLNNLNKIKSGRITLVDGPLREEAGETSSGSLSATITVSDPRTYRRTVLGGSLGAVESYLDGDWDCDNLTTLFRIFARNLESTASMDGRITTAARRIARWRHWFTRNTQRGSRKNIEAHYDLGDDFFRLFLDASMMYSSAIFQHEDMSLEEAQISRLDRICRKLDLHPSDHVLEIGTGWGGFALHAAENYGCRVTTTTISKNQVETATRRVRQAGLGDRVTVLDQDYRDLQGKYDKLVSIEMIEAVGHRYFDAFFGQCGRLLKDSGRMLLQAIVMPEKRYEQYLHSVDFIQKYIFPGGCLPSVTALQQSVARQTDLRLLELKDFAPHYARTLREWRARFHGKLDEVRRLGYSDRFVRMWDYYLCYCEAAFLERTIGVVHAVWGR